MLGPSKEFRGIFAPSTSADDARVLFIEPRPQIRDGSGQDF